MDASRASARLLYGTQRSHRAAHIDNLMREHWGRAFLLVPTRHYAARRLESIILEGGLNGAWGRSVLTFDDFVEQLLKAEGHEPVRVDDTTRRLLLERALGELKDTTALREFSSVADTGGFVSHMLRVITQLKQAAVEPHVFRERIQQRPHSSSIDAVVADVYTAYQHALVEANVYDLPGLFWQAALECDGKRPAILKDIAVLILDGFDDFTPSEFHLLERLRPHLNLLVFGLNYDPNPDQADLFALTARTAHNIAETFGAAVATFEEAPAETQREFAASHIFWRDIPNAPAALTRDIDVLPCADHVQEIETIGRRIKSLLLNGETSEEQVAVIYRNLRPVAGTLRAVFDEFGIPARILQPPALWESAVCSFILNLLEALSEWTHANVIDAIMSPWFPAEQPHVAEIPVLARTAQIIAGRAQWRERLHQLDARLDAGTGEDIEALLKRMPHARAAIAALFARLDVLDAVERLVPARAREAELAAGLLRVLDELKLDESIAAHPLTPMAESERHALAALRRLLSEWQAWNRDETEVQSRGQFALALRQSFQETTYTYPQPEAGVVCMDAVAARHLRFDYVFFAGANEGVMPAPASGSAVYSESELESLRQVGIPLEGRHAQTEREMLLFHHVLCMARKRLCITWHRLGPRGKECYPSPYVKDLLDLFPGAGLEAPMPPATAFVPKPQEAASWRDLRNAIHLHARDAAETWHAQCARSGMGALIEMGRHSEKPFDNHDGVLATPDVIAAIAEEYGEDHLFSVNQLERYAACPFGFYVDRILDLTETQAPAEEFDPRLRGTMMHDALQAFHEHYRGQAVADIPAAEASATMRQAIEDSFARMYGRNKTAPHGVARVEMERLAVILERYLRIERARVKDGWLPTHFEVAFGGAGRSTDELSCQEAFVLETEQGLVLFSGRIDRIDRREGEARIIDYKSTIPVAAKDIKEGRSLQLAVYAMALESLLMKDINCAEAAFVQVGKKERREALGRGPKKDEWGDRQKKVREQIASVVAGIRAGQFQPAPTTKDACSYCGARNACRYEKGRVERKGAAS